MSHKPVTQSCPIPMPRQSGLLERSGRFYLNMRVPKDLRPLYGKKEIIRKSLDTSDRRQAISRVRFEALKLDSEFEKKRRKMKNSQPPPTMHEITEREAHDLVCSWLISQEKLSQDWWDKVGSKFDETDADETLENFKIDDEVFSGGSKGYRAADGSSDLDAFLKSAGFDCPKDSPAYQKLLPLFTKARLENVRRNIARVTHQTVLPSDPMFRDVFAHTNARPVHQTVTVGKMVERFLEYLVAAKRSDKTLRTYKIPCRVLREELGEKTSVENITKERMEELYGLLRRAPTNVTKRYSGLTLKQAVELADKKGDAKRLSAKSLDNYRVIPITFGENPVDGDTFTIHRTARMGPIFTMGKVILTIDGKTCEALDVAEKCINEWDAFITQQKIHLLPP